MVIYKSGMQKTTTLSMTESETVSNGICAQDMMYAKHIVEYVGLKVEIPMVLEVNIKGDKDKDQNFTSGGRTNYMEIIMCWLRKL